MAGLMKSTAGRAGLAFVLIAFGAGVSSRVHAQGATDYPIPSSAKEVYSPIREGFESPIEPREALRGPAPYVDTRGAALRHYERMPEAPAFFRDTKLKANSRTYWFGEDSFGFDKPQALTTGGSLSYESGYMPTSSSFAASSIRPSRSTRTRRPGRPSTSRLRGTGSPRSDRSMGG
jgi:hypothetical protein